MATGRLTDLAIDWDAPWLAPLRDLRAHVGRADWRAALSAEARCRGVATAGGLPVDFVAPDDAGAAAYEAHIAATGRVPTRENAHDLFNALAWLAFPLTKAALNARQAAELARDGVRGSRGPVRDAATLIDESGLLLAAGWPGWGKWLFVPAGLTAGLLWWARGPSLQLVLDTLYACVLVVTCVIDVEHQQVLHIIMLPAIALALGVFIAGESVSGTELAAVAAILCGVAVIVLSNRDRGPSPSGSGPRTRALPPAAS